MMTEKLRIGLLINGHIIPAWTHKMIERIVRNENLEIVLIVKIKNRDEKENFSLKKIWKDKDKLFWLLFSIFENKLYNPQPNAFESTNINDILNCETLNVNTEIINDYDSFDLDDIDKIKKYNVDVFINLCCKGLYGSIFSTAKFGIWSYYHSDRSVNKSNIPGVWEVFKGQEKVGTILEILSENTDFGLRLATSYSATERLSVNRTNNNAYWKALSIVPRKLNELHELGEIKFFKKVYDENRGLEFYDNQVQITPSNRAVLSAVWRIYTNKIANTISQKFYFGQWILLFKFNNEGKWSTSFNEFTRIIPPKDRFWADPFIWVNKGRYYIFLEELIYSEKVGKIAVMEIKKDGSYGSPKIVLDKSYHLSYPFLIEENNEIFMLPETAGNRTIELYKCIEFPLKWELHKVLMTDVYAVDSTILKFNNKYWLFCNVRENEGASSLDELFLFYSESLLNDEWMSHPCNPIISDVSQARPAGNIFEQNGKLYRPSQNSSKGYGHSMKINEIVELTTDIYREETVQSISPNWSKDLIATHTINHCRELTIIDARIKKMK